jgi:hypothetical protein
MCPCLCLTSLLFWFVVSVQDRLPSRKTHLTLKLHFTALLLSSPTQNFQLMAIDLLLAGSVLELSLRTPSISDFLRETAHLHLLAIHLLRIGSLGERTFERGLGISKCCLSICWGWNASSIANSKAKTVDSVDVLSSLFIWAGFLQRIRLLWFSSLNGIAAP